MQKVCCSSSALSSVHNGLITALDILRCFLHVYVSQSLVISMDVLERSAENRVSVHTHLLMQLRLTQGIKLEWLVL